MQPISLISLYFSLLLALLGELLPWSGWGLLLRPDFVLLVVLYWLLRAPHLCNIGTAWFAGLVVDLATGSLFGQHAMAYSLTAFFAVSYQRRMTLFNPGQQAGYVFALLLLTQIMLFVLKLFAGGESPGWNFFLPCISSILLWQLAMSSRIGAHSHSHQN